MDRNKLKEKAKTAIDDIFAKVDELESKRGEVQEDLKVKYDERIADLKTRRVELQSRYKELASASEGKWEEASKAFNSSLDSFKEGFSKLASIFK